MDKLSVYAGQSNDEDDSEMSSSSPDNSSCSQEEPIDKHIPSQEVYAPRKEQEAILVPATTEDPIVNTCIAITADKEEDDAQMKANSNAEEV